MYYQSQSNDLSKYQLGGGQGFNTGGANSFTTTNFGGNNGYTTTTSSSSRPLTNPMNANTGGVQPRAQANTLTNPMAANLGGNTPSGRGGDQSSQYGFRDNDYRTNFNINSINPNQKSSFRDTLGGGFGGGFGGFGGGFNQQSGFPTSSTKIDPFLSQPQYGGSLANQYGPSQTKIPSSAAPRNAPAQNPSYQYPAATPNTNALDPRVKVSDQYQQPPQQKPNPVIDNSQSKAIKDIMDNNKDVDKFKMMDLGNLGKVVYSAALSSSSSSQKYEQTLAELKRNNQQFSDTDFPADKSSLAPPEDQYEYKAVAAWKRPKEIFKNPQLFEGKIEPNDILQGNLGDCYLLSTLAAIAENQDRIKRIFVSQQTSQNGIYAVELVWRGANNQVILDDYLPVDKKNEPYFLKSQCDELWVCLLEKAWAKLHRTYHQLDGQLTKETLHDFTGAPVRSFTTRKDQEQLWNKLLDADKQNYIMTTGTDGEDIGTGDPLRKYGLVSGHAYTLIGAFEVQLNNGQKVRLVRVRNPWGSFEWQGKWSDKDTAWGNVSQSEKNRIGYSVEDDGSFFLEYSGLSENFDGVQICYYNDSFLYSGKMFRSSYQDSKFFEIKIAKDGVYHWNLSQLSLRTFDLDYQDSNTKNHYSDSKFAIMNQSGQVILAFSGKKRDLFSYKQIDNPKTFAAGTYYAFVRIQWQKNATHSFGFGAYGPAKIEQKEIPRGQAGKLGDQVAPWEQNKYPQFEIETVPVM